MNGLTLTGLAQCAVVTWSTVTSVPTKLIDTRCSIATRLTITCVDAHVCNTIQREALVP